MSAERKSKAASPQAKAPPSLRSGGALHKSVSPQRAEPPELPEGWTETTIGDLIRLAKLWVKNGYAEGNFNTQGVGVPHLRTFNISNAGEIDLSQIKWVTPPPPDDPHWLQRGDVIFNNTNSEELVGRAALLDLDGKFVLSNHMTILRVLDPQSLDCAFLASSLHRKWITGEARTLCRRHVNQASINLDRLKGVHLLLPPLAEQRAIAGVLRTVQAAREACERLLAATRQLKHSLLHHLFTYGPVPLHQAHQVPLKQTEIGPMPEHWKIGKIGEICTALGSGVTPRGGSATYLKQGVPLIRSQNVQMQRLDLTDVAYISRQTHSMMSRSAVRPGDVLLNITGASIGRVACVPPEVKEANVNQHVCRIRPTSNVCPEFIAYFLGSRSGQRLVLGAQHGATRQGLNYQQVRAIRIPLPPLSEQREIAAMLGAVDGQIAALEARRAALAALFTSLLEYLMTGRLRLPEFVK